MLEPMVENLFGYPLFHGWRGLDADPEHPGACLCGVPDFLLCDGPGMMSWKFWKADDGLVYGDPAPLQ